MPNQQKLVEEVQKLREDFIKCILSFVDELYPKLIFQKLFKTWPPLEEDVRDFCAERCRLAPDQVQQSLLQKTTEDFKKIPKIGEWLEDHPLSKRFYDIVQRFDNLRKEKHLPAVLTYPTPSGGWQGVYNPPGVLMYIAYLDGEFQRNPAGFDCLKSFVFEVLRKRIDDYIQEYYKELLPKKGIVAKTLKKAKPYWKIITIISSVIGIPAAIITIYLFFKNNN